VDKFVPDIYQKSIYTINYKKLKKHGIKCLLIDLDNTVVPLQVKKPMKKQKELFAALKEQGFKVIIFSNNLKKRALPFKEGLEIDCCCPAFKPFKFKYLKVMREFKYQESEIACIGDLLLTDIYGGNRLGFKTILVNSISVKDHKLNFFNRFIEKIILKKLHKRGLLKIGKYYE
jgi:HAD superfamily phosphatase (TIGR01668 family)